jgi:hypothetical protein
MITNAPASPLGPGHRIAVAAVTLVVVAISALGGLGLNTDSAWYLLSLSRGYLADLAQRPPLRGRGVSI